MRRYKCLLVTAILLVMGIVAARTTANAQDKAYNTAVESNNGMTSAPRIKPVVHKSIKQAAEDAIGIISKNNSCKRFFGDTKTNETVLRRLAMQFEIRLLRDSRTGIEMSGKFTSSGPTEDHAGYRLFDAATINSQGPFLRAKVFRADSYVPPVGSFRPNTREARVLMLLHELAHLVTGEDGDWLIPDDGNDPALSEQNTTLIESKCKPQILSLSPSQTNRPLENN